MELEYVVGIDVGGTNTVFGIVDARGTIIGSDSIKTRAYGTEVKDYLDALATSITQLIERYNVKGKIRGVGIRSSQWKLLYRKDRICCKPTLETFYSHMQRARATHRNTCTPN